MAARPAWRRPDRGTAGYAIDRAADGIAIALLGARESGAKSAQRQNALVNRLLLGDISGDEFVARALRIGSDLRDRALAGGVGLPRRDRGRTPAKKPWRSCAGRCVCPRWSPTSASTPWPSWACRETRSETKSSSG